MIKKTYDYAALDKQLMDEIDAAAAARTPEQIATDHEDTVQSWKRLKARLKQENAIYARAANVEKMNRFLIEANKLRKMTKRLRGWIQITVDDAWLGQVDMRFEQLYFIDFDDSNTHKTFAFIFQRFRDVTISVYEGKVRIQAFDELYDVVSSRSEE